MKISSPLRSIRGCRVHRLWLPKRPDTPIAKIAAKLAIGYRLDELDNQITKSTSALFEPTLDYVIVKIPRWNFDKFEGSERTIGLQMKSVGEVMGIGRSFQEALHKATQSLEIKRNGLGADGKSEKNYEQIIEKLTHASWDRVFVIYDAIQMGIPLSRIHEITKIDMWFLKQYEELYVLEKEISRYTLDTLPRELLLEGKKKAMAIARSPICSNAWKVRFIINVWS